MELLFVYIEKYASLKNQSICLTSKLNIQYDFKKNIITIEDSNLSLSKYFHKNILDIKALIGANGSGKTSVLKYIFDECNSYEKSKSELIDKSLLITIENEILTIAFNKENKITKENVVDLRKEKNKIIYIPYSSKLMLKKVEPFGNNPIIYFSNLFDNNQKESNNERALNISTNYLLRTDKRRNYKNLENADIEQTDSYRSQELLRQISFINNVKPALEFELPEFLNVIIDNRDEDKLSAIFLEDTSNDLQKDVSEYNKTIRKIIAAVRKIRNESKDKSNKDILKFEIQTSILFNYLNHFHYKFKSKRFDLKPIKESILEVILKCTKDSGIDFNKIYKGIKGREIKYSVKTQIGLSIFSKEFYQSKLFWDLTESIIEDDSYTNDGFNLRIANGELIRWLDLYALCKRKNDFLHFTWRDISSGEMAMLNLLARFHYILNQGVAQNKKGFIVLLDEVDIFLHPNWQRKFISILNNSLAPLFGNSKLQIILTSHSPFVTSDLTKSHIHFFKPLDKENRIQEETFAQNIYTLFSNSFYLDSPLGEFANEILGDVISFLDRGESKCIQTLKDAQIIIDSIGEPIIRNQLQKKIFETRISENEQLIELRDYINKKLGDA